MSHYTEIPSVETNPTVGLTVEEVRSRRDAGLDNREIDPHTKSVGQIFLTNICTYYNLVFTVIAVMVLLTGQIQNLAFMGVVISNTLIGIIQELRSKRVIDKMKLVSARTCTVLRNGTETNIPVSGTVRDDIVILSAGDQVFADGVVVSGECFVNEALVTGEADEIKKNEGDSLISGSFVVAGRAVARLTAVGEAAFAARITAEAKKAPRRGQSEMMITLSRLVKWIGIILIPFAAALFCKEYFVLHSPWRDAVTGTAGAIIGMIPEGLYLLTTLALVASVIRLTSRRTLIRELGCIESLARVDVLCVDKTGTITEPEMSVTHLVPLCFEKYSREAVMELLSDYALSMGDENDTMRALISAFPGGKNRADGITPFTSAKKFGGATFGEKVYLFGAPDVILGDSSLDCEITPHVTAGRRVLLFAEYSGDREDFPLTGQVTPVALVVLENKIRPAAPETFRFFARQGVEIKVISGDRADGVSAVAVSAGIRGADRFVDARTLETEDDVADAVSRYTVFGRVTPKMKKRLIRALREGGHTVAMTGDGVNDVLALREADCSVAMASGADAAAHAANIVLLDSDFSGLPAVVAEGRRVINNIERSAALYLFKNIFSFLIALVSLAAVFPYPFSPVQLTLVSTMTIGLPSFVLAMEPNESRVTGKFLRNVLLRALPGGITGALSVIGVVLFCLLGVITEGEMSTMCTIVACVTGLSMLFDTCLPFTPVRMGLLLLSICGIAGAVALFGDIIFGFVFPGRAALLVLAVFILAVPAMFFGVKMLLRFLGEKISKKPPYENERTIK